MPGMSTDTNGQRIFTHSSTPEQQHLHSIRRQCNTLNPTPPQEALHMGDPPLPKLGHP